MCPLITLDDSGLILFSNASSGTNSDALPSNFVKMNVFNVGILSSSHSNLANSIDVKNLLNQSDDPNKSW